MSGPDDPPRLFEADDAPAELRSLLAQAHGDGMEPSAIGRIAAGVEAEVLGPGAPPDPSAGGSGGGSAGDAGPGTGPSLVPKSAAGKAGVGLVVAVVAAGALWLSRGPEQDGDQVAASATTPVLTVDVTQRPQAEEEPAQGARDSVPSIDEAGGVDQKRGSSLPSGPPGRTDAKERGLGSGGASSPAGGSESSRASAKEAIEEHQLLRAARAALERDPARALALTQEHKRRFPAGMLAQEREVIAIEALSRLGRSDDARSRADRFGKEYPDSPHGDRVDDVASGSGGTPR